MSGTHRVAEVASTAGVLADFDVIVNVQGDEPFVSREALLGAARMVTDAGFPLGTAAVLRDAADSRRPERRESRRCRRRSSHVFFAGTNSVSCETRRTPSCSALASGSTSACTRIESARCCTGCSCRRRPLEHIERLEQLRPLAAGMPIGVSLIDEPVRPGIDTEDDLERANRDWTAFTTG